MHELNFVKWGVYHTNGTLRVGDPCELAEHNKSKRDNVVKVNMTKGEYEVLACSAHREYEKGGSSSGLLGIVLKKAGVELDFSKLVRVEGEFYDTTRRVFLLEEDAFKDISHRKSEEILWAPLTRCKSKLLVGEEKNEDPWWEELAIRKNYICSNGLQYNGRFHVYQAPGVLAIFFWPLEADFSKYTIHKKKNDLYKFRAKVIKETLFKKMIPMIELKYHAKRTKDEARAWVIGEKNYSKDIENKVNAKIDEVYSQKEEESERV